ncbi:MAG: hypothetical protein KDD65_17250 [Bacteroidetes bacterium]|nr:hypothetical protein [Bacteroidota bacterium]
MTNTRLFVCCVALPLFLAACSGSKPRIDRKELDRVNALGLALYAYDQAAWHGTDAVYPYLQSPSGNVDPRVAGYIVERDADEWIVMFGRVASDNASYEVASEARLDSSYDVISADSFEVAERRTGFALDAGIALAQVKSRFVAPEKVAYNSIVLPISDRTLYVYMLPAQPDDLVYYVGADFKWEFDRRKGEIVGEYRLHNALLTFDLSEQPDAVTASSAVLSDIPTETDVFYAASRPNADSKATHYVTTSDWVFLLDANGVVARITTEAFRRIGEHQGQK